MAAAMERIDPELKTWASTLQSKYIDSVNFYGSIRRAARELGVDSSSIVRSIQTAKRNAALKGYAPENDLTRPAAFGQKLRGASTLYRRGEPEPVLQWVKTSADEQAREAAIRAAFEAMSLELPRAAPIAPPKLFADAACNVFTLTDSHVGMLAWGKECGEPWDLKIAEQVLVGCFSHLVKSAPRAKIAFVNQLGDFLHSDGLTPVTPTSGHQLDQDGRFSKMVTVAVRVLRRVVDMALETNEKVVLLVSEGNHDPAGSVWLRVMFRALYENEPRVEVVDNEAPYYAYQHGKTMLAFHHGHLMKTGSLPLLFAAQFAEIWGGTTKRYCHTGHRHHVEEKEHSGMTVFQHPTLAARDAYAARGGWHAERKATAVTYHAEFGEVARTTVTPEMLK
jgi:hypothetical protein